MTYSVHHVRRPLSQRTVATHITSLAADEFSGYASLFNEVDGAGDVVSPGAFRATLRARPVAKIRMLYQHSASEPIGVWGDIHEDKTGLFVRGRIITDTSRGRDVMRLIREGAINGLSIGFRTKRADRDTVRHLRILREVELWEISIVTFPLSGNCQIDDFGIPPVSLPQTIRNTAHSISLSPHP